MIGAHIGINRYPAGNALTKCVADAHALAELFGGTLLLDRKANRGDLMALVKKTVARPKGKEWAVLTYSGHGSQAKDRNADEPDGMDETIVSVELDEIVDDEYQNLLAGRNRQARLLVIFDSCFSGNMHRAYGMGRDIDNAPKQIIRYLPPSKVKAKRRRKVTNAGPQAALPNVVVMSACTDFEFAYEGESYGVWTGALVNTYHPDLSIGAWFKAAAKEVADGPFGMVQHPQLSCSRAALKWKVPA
jgi:hypothetical protein